MYTLTFDLPQLLPGTTDCACCLGHLLEALRGRAGIAAARLDARHLVLDVDAHVAASEAERLVHEVGQHVAQRYAHPTFAVEGLGCADCAQRLERALAHLIGVHFARVNLATARLQLEYDREQTSIAAIGALVSRLGYTLRTPQEPTVGRQPRDEGMETRDWETRSGGDYAPRTTHHASPHPASAAFTCAVEGMCCAAEADPIEQAVRALGGVHQVRADPTLARLTVSYDPQLLTPAQIIEQVEQLGFRAAPTTDGGTVPTTAPRPTDSFSHSVVPAHLEGFFRRLSAHGRAALTVLCGLLILAAWLGGLLGAPAGLSEALYVLATLAGGIFVARRGWARLRAAHTLDINALMTIAAVGALLIGEYAEGAAVVFLFALGNALEGYTMERARRSIRALMRLAPETALVRRGELERELPVEQVAIGEVIIIRPGDRIPLDGVVVAGRSAVDQAPITGESMPVEKEAGSELFAGSINGEGALEARVTRPAQASTLARMIQLVEEAQARKAPAQRFIDAFARRYTPAVLILAALVATLPPLAFGEWAPWLYRALVLLVIACPCALVISTPVSIVSAISAAARNGVLFKGGAALEAAGGLRAIAFDKTGTLTVGRPMVTDVIAFEANDLRAGDTKTQPDRSTPSGPPDLPASHPAAADELLALAAAVERRSTHPLARAIVAAAEARGLAIPPADEFRSWSGRGATARVAGRQVTIGNRSLFASDALPPSLEAQLAALEQAGRTVMLVGCDGVPRGIIAAADAARAEGRATIESLKQMGIAHIAMLTGDTARAAAPIATHVGVNDARAGLLPQAKLDAIDQLIAQHRNVGMVGDGINDAPALARATVGVAMGAAGSDVALETADIALMADDLRKLPFAIGLSRSARRVIKQNIAFALAVKALFLVASLAGVATLWMAVFADTGAAVIVIANGMRLLGYRASGRDSRA